MKIVRAGTNPSSWAPPTEFTGRVRRDAIIQADAPGRAGAGVNTFDPGARTHWHTHPAGQILVVTAGRAWVQVRGGKRQELSVGDAAFFPAGEMHWHGATADTGMSHMAITETVNGVAVNWLEPVTDEEYNG